jgi:hypothetical protein
MASLDNAQPNGFFSGDAWDWWQARRLRYNLTLAAAGWLAYGSALGLGLAFHKPMWKSWQGGVGMTLFLGTGFLVLMGVANVCFLLGPAVEGWVRPADVERYRRTAWAMGLMGSAALPFVFPLANLAIFIGQSGGR